MLPMCPVRSVTFVSGRSPPAKLTLRLLLQESRPLFTHDASKDAGWDRAYARHVACLRTAYPDEIGEGIGFGRLGRRGVVPHTRAKIGDDLSMPVGRRRRLSRCNARQRQEQERNRKFHWSVIRFKDRNWTPRLRRKRGGLGSVDRHRAEPNLRCPAPSVETARSQSA